jgi:hypothetical protein
MAAISITAANVLPGSNARTRNANFGATVTQGQVVYQDAADNELKLADADSATAAVRVPVGIALNAGSDGQPGTIQTEGDITIGATLTAGLPYFLSPDTPGGIALIADVAIGDDYVQIGIAKSASVLTIDILVPAVTRAA